MTKHWEPLRSNVLIKVIQMETKTSGGIVLVEDTIKDGQLAKEEGIVISIGKLFGMDVSSEDRDDIQIGDKVAFARYGGKSLGNDKDGYDIRVVRDIDLLAVERE